MDWSGRQVETAVYPSPETRSKLFISEHWEGATEALVDALWIELHGA